MTQPALEDFWRQARLHVPGLPDALPETWAFGATPEHADGLLALVLDGVKTATASSVWDYEATGEAFPAVGDLSIILDGTDAPRALLRTTALEIRPFDTVTAEHAFAEGEDDRSLDSWRAIHERFWTEHSEGGRGFAADMPVLCERFELLYSI